MKKSQISSISKNYAKAILDSAKESNSVDNIKEQLQQVNDIIKSSNDLRIVMDNSSITNSKKKEILNDIFSSKIDVKLLNLLQILVEKNRFCELENIYLSYVNMVEEFANRKNVEIISSISLNEETKKNIVDTLMKKLNCEIIPSWQLDENIIAGLVFKIGDCVIDTSVAAKLKSLSKNILR